MRLKMNFFARILTALFDFTKNHYYTITNVLYGKLLYYKLNNVIYLTQYIRIAF